MSAISEQFALLSSSWPSPIAVAVCLTVLAVAAVIDTRRQVIPNGLTYAAAVVALVFSARACGGPGFIASLTGGLACFLPMVALWKYGATGGGDVKLAGCVGLLLGVWPGLSTIVWACVLAAGVGLLIVGFRHGVGSMCAALISASMPGRASNPATAATLAVRIPMGLPFLLGAIATLAGAPLL